MNFNRNMRRNNNQMPARGGPLVTDHLQDLELELELLKRKRQLIQNQQQEMLYNRAPAGDSMRYDQPSQSYNDRYNEPQQFSHSYNDAPLDNQSFGHKRRSQPDWSPGYDVGGNKRAKQGTFDRYPSQNTQTFPRPRLSQPQPLMGQSNYQPEANRRAPQPLMGRPKGPQPFNHGPKNNSQGPRPLSQHPNFKQNKQPGPNRPGPNRPGPNRPGFAPNKFPTPKKQSSLVKAPNPTLKAKKNAPILLPDEMPSNKTNGRLELALGMIVKEIRAAFMNTTEYGFIFQSMQLCRIMKQGVRDRLHSVMAGKVVGLVPDIVAAYRQKYPVDTDKEIVELAAIEKRNTDHTNELVIKLFEEGDPEQYFKKKMGKVLDITWTTMLRKLEKVLNESKNELTEDILEHLPDIDNTEETKATGSEEVGEKPATEETPEQPANEETPEKPKETKNEVVTETDEKPTEGDAPVEDVPKKTNELTAADAFRKKKDYDKWMTLLLERRLPHLLNRYKNAIIRLFELDNMYRNTKAAIIINTNRKAQALNNKKNSQPKKPEQTLEDLKTPRGDWFFVKVLAVPAMPKRKIMQEFLNQFNPKTIKRHKKNYNLLFVGLDTKENYDKMLAADQAAVGNATLHITGSSNKANNGDAQNKSDADIDTVLTPQLDDQIDDLLSSIRKSDEESKNDVKNESIDLTESKETSGELNDSQDVTEETDSQDVTEVTDANGNEKPDENGSQDATQNAEDPVEIKDDECEVVEPNGKEVVTIDDDEVAPLKSDEVKPTEKAPGTPAKGRAPATPSSIRTRRSSRLN